MSDIFDKKKRSKIMSRIHSKDTKPEWIVRRFLFAHGYRYRKNCKRLPGTPDIVLKKYGVVIFIHGCFWHGHEDSHLPKTNVEFWRHKIERNKERDAQNKTKLKELGWYVMTVWECQLKPAVREQTLNEIMYILDKTNLERIERKADKLHKYQYPIQDNDVPMAAAPQVKYGK